MSNEHITDEQMREALRSCEPVAIAALRPLWPYVKQFGRALCPAAKPNAAVLNVPEGVRQRLFQLLNGAAGDGLIINEIDAAELFTDLFPEHIEFITRGATPDATKSLRPAAQPVGEPVASIPNDGPSTYEQRFTDAVRVICGVTPPAELVRDWIGKTERRDDLQQWVGSYAPGWVQNIAILDAAHVMATQPTEGGTHRTE